MDTGTKVCYIFHIVLQDADQAENSIQVTWIRRGANLAQTRERAATNSSLIGDFFDYEIRR